MVQVADLNNDSVFAICQSDVTGVMFGIVLLGDLNNDRKLDMIVMNNGTDSLSILLLFFLLLIFNKNTYTERRITFVLCILT